MATTATRANRVNVIDQTQSSDIDQPSKPPAHELVYRQLRDQILFGELAPGEAVTIQGIVQSLGAGMTPVREAIRRLIAEGALRFQGNRRVSVPIMTGQDLEQIDFLRKTIEPQLAMRACQKINPTGITRLSEIDTALDAAILKGDVHGYLSGNYRFHMHLYEQAQAPILHEAAQQLWLRFGPSLRVVCGRFGTQNLPDRHKELLRALKMGDGPAAAHAMAEDVAQGTTQMALVLREADPADRFD